MPTTYAHDLFGKRIYQKLDKDIKEKIKEHQEIFQIGLHGPDILFYYEPFHKNPVSGIGSKMHYETATAFFLEGKRLYNKEKDDAVLVYLIGFICHFILDSNCHPYIGEYVASGKARHDEIETDFDRYLMEKTGKDPFKYKPGKVIHPSKEAAKTIAKVIGGVTEDEVFKGLKGIRFFTGITVGNSLYRSILSGVAKRIGLDDYAKGRVYLKDYYPNCAKSTAELARLYEKAVKEGISVINEFLQNLDNTEQISPRFNKNYE